MPLAAIVVFIWQIIPAQAESVWVEYRGEIDLKPFACTEVTAERSNFIERVCYDEPNRYMLLKMKGAYYHHCEIDAATVDSLLKAPSMDRFFKSNVRGSGKPALFDCRTREVPGYE